MNSYHEGHGKFGGRTPILTQIDKLKQIFIPKIEDVIEVYRYILRSGSIEKPIIIEETSMLVISEIEAFEALRLLRVSKVPVLMVKGSEVSVKRIKPREEVTSIDKLLKDYERGIRYPSEDFRIDIPLIEEKTIKYSLEALEESRSFGQCGLRVYKDTLSLLYEGWPTPLVKLNNYSSSERTVYAKLEMFNPFSNSVKDRVAWSMIMDALERKMLGEILYEATSTNTGIALASIANILGRKAKLFIPKSIQKVSDIFLKALGAEVVRMPASLTVEILDEVESLARRNNATHLNQFENDANLKVHLKYTAKELDEQLKSIGVKPDYIIGGLGTSGHMSAISIYFKSKYGKSVKIIGVQPAPDEIVPGIRRVESGMKWLKLAEFDHIIDVTLEEAIEGVLDIARREGLLIGLSSGAVLTALKKISENEGNLVLIFPDNGYKYAEQLEEYFKKHDKA